MHDMYICISLIYIYVYGMSSLCKNKGVCINIKQFIHHHLSTTCSMQCTSMETVKHSREQWETGETCRNNKSNAANK